MIQQFNIINFNYKYIRNDLFKIEILIEYSGRIYKLLKSINIEDNNYKYIAFKFTNELLLKIESIYNSLNEFNYKVIPYIKVLRYNNILTINEYNTNNIKLINSQDANNANNINIDLTPIYNNITNINSSISNIITNLNNHIVSNNQEHQLFSSNINNLNNVLNNMSQAINTSIENVVNNLNTYIALNNQEHQQFLNNFDTINNTLNTLFTDINSLQERVNNFNPNVTVLSQSIAYANYYVLNTFSVNPKLGDLCYRIDEDKLYQYTDNNWIEIDWKKLITATPEYEIGKLRINNNKLEISPNGTNWYQCYPLIGANVLNIKTVDINTYSYLYYLPPGFIAIVNNINHIPLVYVKDIIPMFQIQGFWTYAYEPWTGLRPNNIAISNGDGQHVAGLNTSAPANRVTNMSIVPLVENSNTNETWFNVTLTINSNQRFFTTTVSQSCCGFAVVASIGSGTANANAYWLGTWYNQDGQPFTAGNITIKRLR